MPAITRDIHSFARPEEARVTHVALDLRADFAAKTLSGRSTLTLQRAPGADAVVLDTRDLTIESVTDTSGRALQFTLGDNDADPRTAAHRPVARRRHRDRDRLSHEPDRPRHCSG